jgi:hypothetical protein
MMTPRGWEQRLAEALRQAQADHAVMVQEHEIGNHVSDTRYWEREELLAEWEKQRVQPEESTAWMWGASFALVALMLLSAYWALAISDGMGWSAEALCKRQAQVFQGATVYDDCMRERGLEP